MAATIEDIVRSLSSGLITTTPDGVVLTAAERATVAQVADALMGGPIDVDTARALTSTFIEAVVAPGLTPASTSASRSTAARRSSSHSRYEPRR